MHCPFRLTFPPAAERNPQMAATMEHPKRPEQLRVHVRWGIRRDMPEVLAIESAQFQYPWDEDDFVDALRGRNTIMMVAECQGRIVGYMVYELCKFYLELENFAVHGACQRRGVGRAMVDKLKSKLATQRRTRILVNVRETNLDAQLFFKAMGFRAKVILENEYEDTDEDAYQFCYRYRPGPDERSL
jgi:[ribosomal protein S18]-alanine N-acetyltransferase